MMIDRFSETRYALPCLLLSHPPILAFIRLWRDYLCRMYFNCNARSTLRVLLVSQVLNPHESIRMSSKSLLLAEASMVTKTHSSPRLFSSLNHNSTCGPLMILDTVIPIHSMAIGAITGPGGAGINALALVKFPRTLSQ